MDPQYPTVALFEELRTLPGYPRETIPVPEQIPGLAFFPGGRGVYQPPGVRELPPFPFGGVLVLGQDFDTLSNYRDSLNRGEEDRRGGTWGNRRRRSAGCGRCASEPRRTREQSRGALIPRPYLARNSV